MKNYSFMILQTFTGKQFMNDSNSMEYDSWQVTDMKLEYTQKSPSDAWEISLKAGIKNLFDSRYAGMLLVNASSSVPRYYYPGLPRNFIAGMVVTFR